MRRALVPFAMLVWAGGAMAQPAPVPQAAPQRVLKLALAPRPDPLTAWKAPNRPHWKLPEILAAHSQPSWSQTVVQDQHFTGRFIQMASGDKTRRLMYPDTEMFWVVQSGQMRVSVEGMEPFVAGKSVIVQIPARTPFHLETLGEAGTKFEHECY
ncbi:MAG: hypothetical protein V4601_03520, partial [Pseudomonadota bacterium]